MAHCVREGYKSAIGAVIGHPEYAVKGSRSFEALVKLSWSSNAVEERAMSKLLGRPDDRSRGGGVHVTARLGSPIWTADERPVCPSPYIVGKALRQARQASTSAIQLIFVRRSFLRNGSSAPFLSLFYRRGIWVDRHLIALSPRTTAELRRVPSHIDLAIVYIFRPLSRLFYTVLLYSPIRISIYCNCISLLNSSLTRQDVAPK